jgi:hypothetical protein
MALVGCPWSHIDAKTIEAIGLAGFWKKGLPPIAGGALDQTVSIAQAVEFVWSEQSAWRAHKGMIESPE